jgi:hypothetical protein
VHFVNGVATFKNISLSQAGNYTLQLSDGALPGNGSIPFNLTVNIAQAAPAVATPHPAHSYKSGHAISLSITIKSNAPPTVPFTGAATITDQNDNVLATTSISATGVLHFAVSSLLPGVYVCSVNYAGDTNHAAATSDPFTLNVTI